jgi:hypothetical protein
MIKDKLSLRNQYENEERKDYWEIVDKCYDLDRQFFTDEYVEWLEEKLLKSKNKE